MGALVFLEKADRFPVVRDFILACLFHPYEIGDDPPSVQLPALLPSTLSSFYLDLGNPGPWFDVISQFTALQCLTIVTLNDLRDINSISLLGRLHGLRTLVIVQCNPHVLGAIETHNENG